MKNKPIYILLISLFILIVPSLIYLCFLIPLLSERYCILMASGGVVGGSGFYGATLISDKTKYSSLYKTAVNAFTVMTLITVVQEFIMQIIGFCATFIVCFIVFKILYGVYKDARTRKKCKSISEEITRNAIESLK